MDGTNGNRRCPRKAAIEICLWMEQMEIEGIRQQCTNTTYSPVTGIGI